MRFAESFLSTTSRLVVTSTLAGSNCSFTWLCVSCVKQYVFVSRFVHSFALQ